MFIQFADEREWLAYAFVIVGSGFAGQFLAERLSKTGRVLLLEAGGSEDPLALGAGYYEIESSGLNMPMLGTRLSSFGGSSNHWTGQSHPFSPTIFKDRPGIAGWPIAYEDYAYHLPEAQAWLGLQPFQDPEAPSGIGSGLIGNDEDLRIIRLQTSDPVPLLGDAETERRYAGYDDIDVLLDTRLVDIDLDADGRGVAAIDLIHGPSRQRRRIPLGNLILCAGCIENARLLLWAGRKYPSGNPFLGGPNNLTGKYFTEHPVYQPVDIYFDGRVDLSEGSPHKTNGREEFAAWLPSDGFSERHGLLRFGMLFDDAWQVAGRDPEVADLDPDFLAVTPLLNAVRPNFRFEQTPLETNRITLLDSLDRDGVGKTRLHWEIPPGDLANYRKATMLMCDLLGQKGFARARLRGAFRQEDWSGIAVVHSTHPAGTTRMAHAPSAGVVDRNCRVFGLDNMYIAGTSVFPNGDFLNPTLNLLALAARLAYFLQARPRPGYAYYRYGTGRAENCQLLSGWSHPEDRGIWTDAAQSVVRIPRHGAKTLTLFGRGFRKVEVRLAINGIERYCGPATKLMRLSLVLDEAPDVELTFEFAHLHSPKDCGESDDARLLGFFLQRIELR